MPKPLCAWIIATENRFCRRPSAYRDGGKTYCGSHAPKVGATEAILRPRRDLYRENRPQSSQSTARFNYGGIDIMAVLTGTLKSAQVDLPFGAYGCRIVLTTDTFSKIQGKENEPQVEVKYQTLDYTDADGEPVQFTKWYSVYNPVKPSHLLGQVFSAALYKGEPFPEGAILDTADLQQKRIDIIWGPYKKRDGTMGAGITGHAAFTKRAMRSAADVLDDDDDDDDLNEA